MTAEPSFRRLRTSSVNRTLSHARNVRCRRERPIAQFCVLGDLRFLGRYVQLPCAWVTWYPPKCVKSSVLLYFPAVFKQTLFRLNASFVTVFLAKLPSQLLSCPAAATAPANIMISAKKTLKSSFPLSLFFPYSSKSREQAVPRCTHALFALLRLMMKNVLFPSSAFLAQSPLSFTFRRHCRSCLGNCSFSEDSDPLGNLFD